MAKPLQQPRDNRAAEKKDLSFHPFAINPETAHTSILLLESKEPEVLCQTLRAITKFAAQDMSNRELLEKLDAVRYILPHITHPEFNIKRFALKALAQLCQLPKVPEQVLADPMNLRKIAQILSKIEDIFVLEFASLNLAELTREPLGCEQLVSANILNRLFNRMKDSLDPDVQKNCLQTLSNVLNDPVCASEVTKNKQFSWPSLLVLMQSKFLAIQHAALKTVDQLICRYKDEIVQKTFRASTGVLDLCDILEHAALKTVDQLICRYKDEIVQKTFRASTGVLDLCDILESYEFRDVHDKVLNLLRNYAETEENSAHLYQSGCLLRLLAYLEMAIPSMKPHCLSVLTKMSFTLNGREALYQTNTDLVFCAQLSGSNMELLGDAAMGVANMTKMLPSAVKMSDTPVIESLCSILGDDYAPWFYIRMNSLRALAELCRVIPKAAFSLVEPKTFTALRNINRRWKETPIEGQRLAVECYINLQSYHESTKAMLNQDFMQELLNILSLFDIKLKILACKAISGLMERSEAKELFTLRGGEKVVADNLPIEHVGFRTAVCCLITSSVTAEGAEAYLELGTIHYMVNNRQARYTVSAWEAALEQIFKHHPSAKFGYTGRLDINDFTSEGFYVLKRLENVFPSLKSVLQEPPPFRHPVFVSCFYQGDGKSSFDIRTPYTTKSVLQFSSSTKFRTLFGEDHNLPKYLKKLKIWFGDPSKSLQYIEMADAQYEVRYREKCSEVSSTLKQKAKVLAEFVVQQMSGVTQERDCSLPGVDLYLGDMMTDVNSRVLSLGWISCGGALERAILFKVLADRIGLPCALHRTSSAHAWCEIAVPELDPVNPPKSEESYPAGLLRANYVVDLSSRPGRLVPRGGKEAADICGPSCRPRYTASTLPEVCKCE